MIDKKSILLSLFVLLGSFSNAQEKLLNFSDRVKLDSFVDSDQVYTLYTIRGNVYIETNNPKGGIHKIPVDSFTQISEMNGGSVFYYVKNVKFDNSHYFHVYAGQQFSNRINALYKFKNGIVTKLSLATQQVIKLINISEDQKEWYNELNNIPPKSEDQLKRYTIIDNYIDRPYTYYNMRIDEKLHRKDEIFLYDYNFSDYKLINISNSNISSKEISRNQSELTNEQKTILETSLKDVLVEFSTLNKSDTINIYDFIININTIYLFVKVNSNLELMVKYDSYRNEWHLVNYKD